MSSFGQSAKIQSTLSVNGPSCEAPKQPIPAEIDRLDGLLLSMEEAVDRLVTTLHPVLLQPDEAKPEMVIGLPKYGVPLADHVAGSNNRIERQLDRLHSIIQDLAI